MTSLTDHHQVYQWGPSIKPLGGLLHIGQMPAKTTAEVAGIRAKTTPSIICGVSDEEPGSFRRSAGREYKRIHH
jgi:hypothetical protein